MLPQGTEGSIEEADKMNGWRESEMRSLREREKFMDVLRESRRERQDRTNAEEEEEKSGSVGVFFCMFF